MAQIDRVAESGYFFEGAIAHTIEGEAEELHSQLGTHIGADEAILLVSESLRDKLSEVDSFDEEVTEPMVEAVVEGEKDSTRRAALLKRPDTHRAIKYIRRANYLPRPKSHIVRTRALEDRELSIEQEGNFLAWDITWTNGHDEEDFPRDYLIPNRITAEPRRGIDLRKLLPVPEADVPTESMGRPLGHALHAVSVVGGAFRKFFPFKV